MTNTNIIRKVTIKTNDRYTETIELSHIENNPDFYQKRVAWATEFNGIEKESVTQVGKKFLEQELKKLDMAVRHYGKRVLEDVK